MNYLTLVQKLMQKTGAPGTTPITTTANQTGEVKDYCDWTNEAWQLIQAEHEFWKWMRKDVSFQTAAGKISYLPTATAGEVGISDFAKWHDEYSWRCYSTAIGRSQESYLVNWDYQTFRDTYDFGIQSTIQSKPDVWAIRDEDKAIMLGQTPDGIYTVTGQYQQAPIAFALDADIPGLPARFHWVIVYRAMMLYGKYEAAPEVTADGKEEYDKLMAALELDQLETLGLGRPLA